MKSLTSLDRWDAALLAVHFIDAYGDQLFVGNMVMFVTERLGASNVVSAIALASFEFCVALYITAIAGRLQDQWPEEGPLGSVVICKALGMIVLSAIAFLSQWKDTWALIGVCVIINVLYAATEAFSANAYILAIQRSTVGRPHVEDALWRGQYFAFNLAVVAARLTMAGARWWYAPRFSSAHLAILIAAAIAFFLAIGTAWRLHRYHKGSPSMRGGGDVVSVFPDWTIIERGPLGRYAFVCVAMLGAGAAFLHLDATLPKYMMRDYGEAVWFPLFQAINPVAILVLVPIVAIVPVPVSWRERPIAWICVGTIIITVSFIPMALIEWEWIVVPSLILFTMGEALGMSVVSNYVLAIMPLGRFGAYQSVLAIPKAMAGLLILASSGWLLDTYCPSTASCSSSLWFWVAAMAIVTPIGTGWLWYRERRSPYDQWKGPRARATIDILTAENS